MILQSVDSYKKIRKRGNKKLPNTINSKYAYVINNPIMLRDPSGKSFKLKMPRITLSQKDQSTLIRAAIIVAAAYTGGLAAEAFASGAWSGFFIGAGTGGVVGGVGFEAFGVGNFQDGFIAGAIAGGLAGYRTGSAMEASPNSSQIGRSPASRRPSGVTDFIDDVKEAEETQEWWHDYLEGVRKFAMCKISPDKCGVDPAEDPIRESEFID